MKTIIELVIKTGITFDKNINVLLKGDVKYL